MKLPRLLPFVFIVTGLMMGLSLVFACAPTALAAGTDATESITLSPVSQHYTFDAGATKNDALTITNSGATAYNFIVYARPYAIINSDYNSPNYGDKANSVANADVYKWVSFPQTTYHVNAGQSVSVPYTVHVPSTAAPGGHFGVIFAETQAPTGNGSVTRDKRVGMVVYANVNGASTTSATVSRPTIPFFQIQPPLAADVSVQNTGNTGVSAAVTYRVTTIFGKQRYGQQKDYDVLPDTTRAISLEWAGAPSFGLYKVQVSATAAGTHSESSGYVFMAPFWFYGIIAIVIVGGIMYAVARRRS